MLTERAAPGVLVGTWFASAEVAVNGIAVSVGQAVLVGAAATDWTVGWAAVVDASGVIGKASWRIRASAPGAMIAMSTYVFRSVQATQKMVDEEFANR